MCLWLLFGMDCRGQMWLFLPDEHVDGAAVHGPILSYLVFEEPAVVFFHILRQIGVEDEGRYLRVGQLCAILDFDVFPFDAWWGKGLDDGQHDLVELGRTDACLPIEVDLLGRFEHAENALLGEGRGEDDGEIYEGRHAAAYGGFEGVDDFL